MPTARLLTNGAQECGVSPNDETDNPSGMPSARLCPMPAARQGRTDTRSERRTPVAVRAGDPPA